METRRQRGLEMSSLFLSVLKREKGLAELSIREIPWSTSVEELKSIVSGKIEKGVVGLTLHIQDRDDLIKLLPAIPDIECEGGGVWVKQRE